MTKKLQLSEGTFYRAADGRKAGPAKYDPAPKRYGDGNYLVQLEGEAKPRHYYSDGVAANVQEYGMAPDLVSEWCEPVYDGNIRFFNDIGLSPAWQMVLPALLELQHMKLVDHPITTPAVNDPCMIFEDASGAPLGFLTYRPDPSRGTFYILLAYVLPECRRDGIHTKLFEALVARAIARGDILAIECGTHADNKAAQSAFEAQGRQRSFICYRYPIMDRMPGKGILEEIV